MKYSFFILFIPILLLMPFPNAAAQSVGEGPFMLAAPTGATNIQWFKDGTAISGETNATYEASAEGVYWAQYDDPVDDCTIVADCYNIIAKEGAATQTIINAPAPGTNFIWKKDDATISGATDNNLKINNLDSEIGTYTLEYESADCLVTTNPVKLYILQGSCSAGTIAPPIGLPTQQ